MVLIQGPRKSKALDEGRAFGDLTHLWTGGLANFSFGHVGPVLSRTWPGDPSQRARVENDVQRTTYEAI